MAFPSKFGSEFLVNTTTEDNQVGPSVTALADGRFVISWMDTSQSGGDTSIAAIRAQVFNADGSPSGAEFLVNTTTASDQLKPSITALADGRFVISWEDFSASGADTSFVAIRAQVFNSDGSPFGSEFLVNTTTANSQFNPSVATLADGRFVVSWSDLSSGAGDTSGYAIRAQIFDPREAAVTLVGSGLDDDFVGTRFDDVMSRLVGDDLLHGRGGDDNLRGGVGTDLLKGGTGNDRLWGGGADDLMRGGQGDDRLYGGKGNDILNGGLGLDLMVGGAGDDLLRGKDGDDTLNGGLGRDRMTGGTGADTFVFNAVDESGLTKATRDVIRDFNQGDGDVVDLSGIDAGTGDQAFRFVGTSGFSSVVGEVRFFQTASNTIVQGDVDGDGIEDFEILLNGLINLTSVDFVL